MFLGYVHTREATRNLHSMYTEDVRKYNCIIKRPHWPYINFVVRRDY
jgi:hypothetical protein